MSIRLTTTLLTVALLAMSFALAEAQPQPRPPQPKGGGGGGGQPSQSGEIITSTTPEVTARLLRDAGYGDVKLYKAPNGTTHVLGTVSDIPVSVIHQSDNNNQVRALLFLVKFAKQDNIDTAYANAWNLAKPFVRAVISNEGELLFAMDFDIMAGVTPPFITRAALIYATLLKQLLEFKPNQ